MGFFTKKTPPQQQLDEEEFFDDQEQYSDYDEGDSEFDWPEGEEQMAVLPESSETSNWDQASVDPSATMNRVTGQHASMQSSGTYDSGSTYQSSEGGGSYRDSQMSDGSFMSGQSGNSYRDSQMSDGSFMSGQSGNSYRDSQMSDGSYMTAESGAGSYRDSQMSDGSYMTAESGAGSYRDSQMSDASFMSAGTGASSRVPHMSEQQIMSTKNIRVPSVMSSASSKASSRAPSVMSQQSGRSKASSRAPSVMSQQSGMSRQSGKSKASSRAPSMMSQSQASSRVSGRSQQSKASSRAPSMMSQQSGMSQQSRQSGMTQQSRQSGMSQQSKASSRAPSMMSQQSGRSKASSRAPSMMSNASAGTYESDNPKHDSFMSEQSEMSGYSQEDGGMGNYPTMMSMGVESDADASEGGWDDESRMSKQSGMSMASSQQGNHQSSRSMKSSASRKSNRTQASRASRFKSSKPSTHATMASAIPEGDSVEVDENDEASGSAGSNGWGAEEQDAADVKGEGGHARYRRGGDGKWAATQSTRRNFVPMFLRRQTVRNVPKMGGHTGANASDPTRQGKQLPEFFGAGTGASSPGSNFKPVTSPTTFSGNAADSAKKGEVNAQQHSRYNRDENGRWAATQSTRMTNVPGVLKRFTVRIKRDKSQNEFGGYQMKPENARDAYYGKNVPAGAK